MRRYGQFAVAKTDFCCQDTFGTDECLTGGATDDAPEPGSPEAWCAAAGYEFDSDSWKDDRTAYKDDDDEKVRCSALAEADGNPDWARCCCEDTDWCCQDSLDPDDCKVTAANGPADDGYGDDDTPMFPDTYCAAAGYALKDDDFWEDDRTAYKDAEGEKVRCSSLLEANDDRFAKCCCQDTSYCCKDSLDPSECKTTAEAAAAPTP